MALSWKVCLAYAAAQSGVRMMYSLFMFYSVSVWLERFHITPFGFQFSQGLYAVWNALNDPWFAYIQSKREYPWSRTRRHSILHAAPVFCASFLLLWFPFFSAGPAGGEETSGFVGADVLCVAQYAFALFLWDGAYTYVSLALCGLLADLSPVYEDRVRILLCSGIGGAFGQGSVLICGYFSSNLVDYQTFQAIVVVVATLSLTLMVAAGLTARTPYDNIVPSPHRLSSSPSSLLGSSARASSRRNSKLLTKASSVELSSMDCEEETHLDTSLADVTNPLYDESTTTRETPTPSLHTTAEEDEHSTNGHSTSGSFPSGRRRHLSQSVSPPTTQPFSQFNGVGARLPPVGSYMAVTKQVLQNRNFRVFVAMNFLQELHITYAPTFMKSFTGSLIPESDLSSSARSMCFGLMYITQQIVFVLINPLMRYFGHYNLIQAAILVKVILGTAMFTLTVQHTWAFMGYLIMDTILAECTFGYYGLVLSEISDEDQRLHKRSVPISTMIFGTNALLVKPAISLAPMLCVALLNTAGYREVLAGHASTEQTSAVSSLMFSMACLIPPVLGVCQFIVWRQYTTRNYPAFSLARCCKVETGRSRELSQMVL